MLDVVAGPGRILREINFDAVDIETIEMRIAHFDPHPTAQLPLHPHHDVRQHAIAHVLGQLDELQLVAERANSLRQIARVDGDAIRADARTGAKHVEPERLGRCSAQ
jgi:hypothetical protein